MYKTGGPFVKWEVLQTKGVPPAPRYGHGMVYNPNMGLIVIHGGRNDEDGDFYDDIHSINE